MKSSFTNLALSFGAALLFFTASGSVAQTAESKNVSKVSITVLPNLVKFDVTRFDVTAGAEVELDFSNPCVLPHNLVLVQPEAEAALTAAVGAMGLEGMEKQFVPEVPGIVAATKLLQPGNKEKLRFKAPEAPGEYPYVCTFPGHWFTMRGVMRVLKAGQKLSGTLKTTVAATQVPDALRDSGMKHKPLGTFEKPYVMRSFVPDPGLDSAVFANHSRAKPAVRYDPNTRQDILEKKKDPATGQTIEVPAVVPTQPGIAGAIAVNHGKEFSYVWDSTECRLMYAWRGGFLDMNWYWGKEPGSGRPKIYIPKLMGAMVYRASGRSPTAGRVDEVPRFGGYQMVQNRPEFWYQIGASTIREQIVPMVEGGFELQVRVEGAPREWKVAAADKDFVQVSGAHRGAVLGEITIRFKDRPEPAFADEPFEPASKKK
jgi:azurin